MLEDRDYMRQPDYYRPHLSFTVALLVVNAAVFLVELVAFKSPARFRLHRQLFGVEPRRLGAWLCLATADVPIHARRLDAHDFQYAGHLFLRTPRGNGFGTQPLSDAVFVQWRHRRTLQMLPRLAWPSFFGSAVVGASAGAYGLVAAFAILNWRERFTLLIYFIPGHMRGRSCSWSASGWLAVGIFLTPNSNIANAAHLGGILTGIVFVRQFIQGRWAWPPWGIPRRRAGRTAGICRHPRRQGQILAFGGRPTRRGIVHR